MKIYIRLLDTCERCPHYWWFSSFCVLSNTAVLSEAGKRVKIPDNCPLEDPKTIEHIRSADGTLLGSVMTVSDGVRLVKNGSYIGKFADKDQALRKLKDE